MSDPVPQNYRPEVRRPIARLFRLTAGWAVRLCVRLRIHPDWISWSSLLASLLSAFLFWQSRHYVGWLVLAPLPSLARLWLNMLDGMVALASGRASKRGEIANDLPDRVSDWLVFAGIAHSSWASTPLAYWAGGCALLVAYVGTFGQAVGAGRQFGGLMAKPWRIVAVSVGSLYTWWRFTGGASESFDAFGLRLTVMDVALLVVLIGGAQTIWVRLRRIVAHLSDVSA